ncbi:MAG: SGNH/GDSL hydrolase family protein [Actinomycetales bacterium]
MFVAIAAIVGLLVGVAPAQAATPSYVALGDSYSSGLGTRSYLNDGTSCMRSVYAYPSLLAADRGMSLSLRACSGARISDVRTAQLPALSAGTSYVTISVGGNDAGFVDVLTECAKPAWMSDCYGRINQAESIVRNQLPSQLSSLYAEIKARAPQAKVTVVGYPRLFNGTDCSWFTWFSSQEMSRLNGTADLLNSVTRNAAASSGIGFADPTRAFTGHAVCDRTEWLNGLSVPVSESFHPNRSGHASGYLPVVAPSAPVASPLALTSAEQTGSASAESGTVGSTMNPATQTAALTADARRFTVTDRAIVPETIARVDLHSPAARAAAARAGVNVDDRASVDAADRIWSQRQAAAAAAAE